MDVARTRDASPCPVGFIGDLTDPWVANIAGAIGDVRPLHRVACAGPLSDRPFGDADIPRAVVVHRHQLGAADAARIESWRTAAGDRAWQLVLIVSPYVRYEDLERWSGLVDMVVSEAVAAEILPGRLSRRFDGTGRGRPGSNGSAFRIEVVGDGELGRALVDACRQAGYDTRPADDHEAGGSVDRRPTATERVLTICEIPVLEPDWAGRLGERASRTGAVIALAGFADRAVVTRAREAGAVACLELPCDLDDLIDVVDRVAGRMSTDPRPIPARAELPHRLPPSRRDPRRHRPLVAPDRWPGRGAPPTIA